MPLVQLHFWDLTPEAVQKVEDEQMLIRLSERYRTHMGYVKSRLKLINRRLKEVQAKNRSETA